MGVSQPRLTRSGCRATPTSRTVVRVVCVGQETGAWPPPTPTTPPRTQDQPAGEPGEPTSFARINRTKPLDFVSIGWSLRRLSTTKGGQPTAASFGSLWMTLAALLWRSHRAAHLSGTAGAGDAPAPPRAWLEFWPMSQATVLTARLRLL